jgi:hypothetical protein
LDNDELKLLDEVISAEVWLDSSFDLGAAERGCDLSGVIAAVELFRQRK